MTYLLKDITKGVGCRSKFVGLQALSTWLFPVLWELKVTWRIRNVYQGLSLANILVSVFSHNSLKDIALGMQCTVKIKNHDSKYQKIMFLLGKFYFFLNSIPINEVNQGDLNNLRIYAERQTTHITSIAEYHQHLIKKNSHLDDEELKYTQINQYVYFSNIFILGNIAYIHSFIWQQFPFPSYKECVHFKVTSPNPFLYL